MSGGGGRFILIGAILAALGVGAGAFGAHGLTGLVTEERLRVFDTAVRYHLIHAVALVVIGLLVDRRPSRTGIKASGDLFLAGIVLFSGSLYTLVLTDTPWLGAVTPFGGVSLIAGWLTLAWAARGEFTN